MNQHDTFRKSVPFLAMALAVALAGPASAGALRIESGGSSPRAAAGEFGFVVKNDGAGSLDAVRVVADRNHAVTCANTTTQGRSFAPQGSLAGGDGVACSGRLLSALGSRDASLTVVARDVDGKPRLRSVHVAQPLALNPAQGIVAVLGGASFNDSNSNGQLDAGETIDYHYTVLNLGTLALSGLAVADGDGIVTCPQTALAVGASMACTRQHTITAGEAAAGEVGDPINVTGTDADGQPVQANDYVLRVNFGGNADVRAFKSPRLADDADDSGYASLGDVVEYTFVLKNSGGQALTSVGLTEPDASRIDTPIVCASATLGGQPFAGIGPSGILLASDAVLCTARYTIKAADVASGQAHNLAEISAQPPFGGAIGGAAASDVVIPTPASVAVTKVLLSESGQQSGIAEPGETLTYGIRLDNGGGADALNVGIVDPLDPNVTFVSATHGGVNAGGSVTWSGLTVPAGGFIDLTVVVTVADPLPAGVVSVVNLAYETGTTPPDCSVTPLPSGCVVMPTEGLVAISKALVGESGSKPGIAEAGETLTYEITLANHGGSAITGYGVSDPLDPNVTFVSADNGGTFAAGVVSWTNLTVPAGGSLVLNVVVKVVDPLPLDVTHIANVAHETGTPPADCTLVPTPASCAVVPADEAPRLQVTKTVDATQVQPGGTATFTITVTNVGTVVANNVTVADPLPPGVAGFAWTCTASGGATCAHASGSGAINETVPVLPIGGRLVFTVVATMAGDASGNVINTVSVEPSSVTVCMPAGTPAPCDASAPVRVIVEPKPVPVDGGVALLLLGLGLAAGAARNARRP